MSAISAVATRLAHESITAISTDVALLPFLRTTKLGGEARDLIILQLNSERSQVRQLQWDIASQLITCEVDKVSLARRGEEIRGDRSLDVVVIEIQVVSVGFSSNDGRVPANFGPSLKRRKHEKRPRLVILDISCGSWPLMRFSASTRLRRLCMRQICFGILPEKLLLYA